MKLEDGVCRLVCWQVGLKWDHRFWEMWRRQRILGWGTIEWRSSKDPWGGTSGESTGAQPTGQGQALHGTSLSSPAAYPHSRALPRIWHFLDCWSASCRVLWVGNQNICSCSSYCTTFQIHRLKLKKQKTKNTHKNLYNHIWENRALSPFNADLNWIFTLLKAPWEALTWLCERYWVKGQEYILKNMVNP